MAIPNLSIIIASINGKSYLAECLRALRQQTGHVSAEIIVADCVGPSVTDYVRREHPDVHLIPFSERKSVPELRSAGILASCGDIVAITEDHCLPTPDWYTSIWRAHAQHPEPAIGGAVDNAATDRLIDWAVYFCEYSNYISPVPSGIVHDLPGPNVSYKRSALTALRDLIEKGYWETFLHWRLESQGQQLRSDPSIRVLHKKHFRFEAFLAERFHYARAFAGTRIESISPPRRLFYTIFSLFLPPLLIVRIGRRVWSRGQHLDKFVRALPIILLFMLAWAAGEFVGYIIGPGESALQLT